MNPKQFATLIENDLEKIKEKRLGQILFEQHTKIQFIFNFNFSLK